jgi:hypothetical protein
MMCFGLLSSMINKQKYEKKILGNEVRTPFYFNQKLDHFNFSDRRYFTQKYLKVYFNIFMISLYYRMMIILIILMYLFCL